MIAVCLFFVVPLFVVVSVARGEIEVGTGVRVITPNPLLPISGGIGMGTQAHGKQGELNVRAIVFKQGPAAVGVVSVDVIGFPGVLAERVRAKVPRIPNRNILVGCTHTHSAGLLRLSGWARRP